jgi:nucleotide-binding universal stress UspA family protein
VLAAEEVGVCEALLGSLAAAGTSVIVVPPQASIGKIRHILLPFDGTPSAAAALGPASELAMRAGAAIDLVLIQDARRPPPAEPGTLAPPRYLDQPQHEWPAFSAETIQRFIGSIGHRLTGVPVRFFLGAGRPSVEVLHYARELGPDLIALMWQAGQAGGHPHTPGREAQPGALFTEVLAGARQPILVVRR